MALRQKPRVFLALGLLASASRSSTRDRLSDAGPNASKAELVALLGPPLPPDGLLMKATDDCADPVAFKDQYDSRVMRWLDDRLGPSNTYYFTLCFDSDGRRQSSSGGGVLFKDY